MKKRKKQKNRIQENYPVFISKLNLKGLTDGLSWSSMATARITHENQHIFCSFSTHLHQLYGSIIFFVFIFTFIRTPPNLMMMLVAAAITASAMIPRNSLPYLLCNGSNFFWRRYRQRHGCRKQKNLGPLVEFNRFNCQVSTTLYPEPKNGSFPVGKWRL